MSKRSSDLISVPVRVIDRTTDDRLSRYRERKGWRDLDEMSVAVEDILACKQDFTAAVEVSNDAKFARAFAAILAAEQGDFATIPNIDVAARLMADFLALRNPTGWLYRQHEDGVQPHLVTGVHLHDNESDRGQDGKKTLIITLRTAIPFKGGTNGVENVVLAAADVSRRAPERILNNAGLFLETNEFRQAYDEELAHFEETIPQFGEQFRLDGLAFLTDGWGRAPKRRRTRVILDLSRDGRRDYHEEHESQITGNTHPAPVLTMLPCFDLARHDFIQVRAAGLTEYVYDESLSDKLVLPDSHRTLMDVLTTEIEAFTGDFVEDKAAGNVILCQGEPGVGKTLTAEVYAEIIKRPLYRLSTVSLGLTPEAVAKSLQVVFERAKRWNAVLLLDEADVFVTQRGTDLVRDAIVAEFLRVMEYFDGLMFMTTNRSNTIDEAILSRCAAIVPYSLPTSADARLIWRKIAEINEANLGEDLISALVETFPRAAPRDIKMLLRLVLRVQRQQGGDLTLDLFKRYAVFRDMEATR